MIKKILLFTLLTIALTGCSNTIEKKQDAISEKQKTVNQAQISKTAQEPTKEVKKIVAENDQTPIFANFTQERYSELLGKKPLAIFFHASWCSTCAQLTKEINKDLANFPKGTTILKADYDTETNLKKDYGIVMQATIVVIDKNGKVTQTLAAPSMAELQKAISQTV
ncbi:thioredoxin family protein [Candidatus Peregrinibacteria bacterium]|nr:thioredoxin family protein [Candidatus Peregrinibacteria bacterium]